MKWILRGLPLLLIPLAGVSARDLPNYGDAAAAYSLQNYAAAARTWRRLAGEGDARAGYHLAMLTEQGLGTGRDPGEARRLYRQAAEAGNMAAAARLGAVLLADGDPEAARRWLEKAAESGIPRAQYGLAGILLRARGGATSVIRSAPGAGLTRRRGALPTRPIVRRRCIHAIWWRRQ